MSEMSGSDEDSNNNSDHSESESDDDDEEEEAAYQDQIALDAHDAAYFERMDTVLCGSRDMVVDIDADIGMAMGSCWKFMCCWKKKEKNEDQDEDEGEEEDDEEREMRSSLLAIGRWSLTDSPSIHYIHKISFLIKKRIYLKWAGSRPHLHLR